MATPDLPSPSFLGSVDDNDDSDLGSFVFGQYFDNYQPTAAAETENISQGDFTPVLVSPRDQYHIEEYVSSPSPYLPSGEHDLNVNIAIPSALHYQPNYYEAQTTQSENQIELMNNSSSFVESSPAENSEIYNALQNKQIQGQFNSEKFISVAQKHKQFLHYKQQLEAKTQEGHSLLWTYVDQQRTLEGVCGCRNAVKYNFTFQVAQYDARLAQSLAEDFKKLHEWNTEKVFMSLYQQTHCELNFSNFFHNQVQQLRDTENLTEMFAKLQEMQNPLFRVLEKSDDLSSHSVNLVRDVILYTSAILLETLGHERANAASLKHSSNIIPVPDLLSLDENSIQEKTPSVLPDIETISETINNYFLMKLAAVNGFSWGSSLITIKLNQLEENKFLRTSSKRLIQQKSSEEEFLSLLSQFQWKDIEEYTITIETVQREILSPLKRIISFAASESFFSVLLLAANILLICSYEFSEIAYECISCITGGNWPTKLVCAAFLSSAPLFSFVEQDLVLMFSNLYNLHSISPLEYFKTAETKRQEHREQFARYVVNFLLPAQVQAINGSEYQPILYIFYQIAGHSSEYLQRLITQELAFYAFSDLSNLHPDPTKKQLLKKFQQEANQYLQQVLNEFPHLLSSFVFSIGSQPNFDIEKVLNMIDDDLFKDYEADTNVLNMISYLVCGFSLPAFGGSLDKNSKGIENVLQALLFTETPTNNSTATHKRIGFKLFRTIPWTKTTPANRLLAGLIVIAAKGSMMPRWSVETLLSERVGSQFVSLPFDDIFIQMILDVDAKNQVPETKRMEFTLFQLMCGIGVFLSRSKHNKLNELPKPDSSNYIENPHAWLVSWGFYQRLEEITKNSEFNLYCVSVAKLLVHFDPLREHIHESTPFLRNFFATFISNSSEREATAVLQQELLDSLLVNFALDSGSKEHIKQVQIQRIGFWGEVFFPSSDPQEEFNSRLFDDLCAFTYCSGYSLDPLITLLRQANMNNKETIAQMFKRGKYWIVLLLLVVYEPAIPVSSETRKESGWYLISQFAQKLGNENNFSVTAAAVAFWLHFFSLFFSDSDMNYYLPSEEKEFLSSFFVKQAKLIENKNKEIHRLFFSFSSWNKEVLDTATGDFHVEQNIKLLEDLFSLLPAHFHLPISPRIIYNDTTDESKKTFISGCSPDTIETLIDQLPLQTTKISSTSSIEFIEQNENFHEAIINATKLLFEYNGGETSELPAIEHLRVLLHSYKQTSISLSNLDNSFLELSKQSRYNFSSPFQLRVNCNASEQPENCTSPALIQGNTNRIAPVSPEILPELQRNRNSYSKEFTRFFDLSRGIANVMVLLQSSVSLLCADNSSNFLEIFSPEEIAKIQFDLFSFFFTEIKITHEYPQIHSHYIEMLLQLGRKVFPSGNAEKQISVFQLFLSAPIKFFCTMTLTKDCSTSDTRSISSFPEFSLEFRDCLANDEDIVDQVISDEKLLCTGDLVELFSPDSLLGESENRETYLALLMLLIEDSSSKTEEEQILFASRFHLEKFLATAPNNDPEIQQIISLLPWISQYPAFTTISNASLQFLAQRINESLQSSNTTIELLFSNEILSLPLTTQQQLFTQIQLEEFSGSDIAKFLTEITNKIPSLSVTNLPAILIILRKFTADFETFQRQLQLENPTAYDTNGQPIHSTLWDSVFSLYSIIFDHFPLATSPELHSTLCDILEVLYDSIVLSAAPMIDKLWYLLSQQILPRIPPPTNSHTSSNQVHELLQEFATKLNWNAARFLLYDQSALGILTQLMLRANKFVCALFGRLDWNLLMKNLFRSQNESLISSLGLQYLRLFLLVNLIDSTSIPSTIRFRTVLLSKQEEKQFRDAVSSIDESQPFLDWKLLSGSSFAACFSGEIFVQALKSGMIHNADELSNAVLDNCFILRSIAMEMNSPLAAVAAVREITSLLFFCMRCSPSGSYWYLSLTAHTSLITGALIPLAHQFASESRETREMALSIVSCLLYKHWPTPIETSSELGIYSTYPSQYNGDASRGDVQQLFYEKVRGLVIQFCGAASPVLAIHILHVIPLPDYQEDSSVPHLSPQTWVDLVEITLRAFVVSSEDRDVLLRPCEAFNISIPDRLVVADTCIQTSSGMALLVLLYQWKNEFSSQWDPATPWPSQMFEKALTFIPARYRSFDRLLFWFFILELVQSPRFHPVQCQQDSWKFLNSLREISLNAEVNKNEPHLILAAKLTEIFFYRVIREKNRNNSNSRADAALNDLLNKLTQLQSKNQFSAYNEFWGRVHEVLEPTFGLVHLKMLLLQTLVPNAEPIVGKVFGSSATVPHPMFDSIPRN